MYFTGTTNIDDRHTVTKCDNLPFKIKTVVIQHAFTKDQHTFLSNI